MRRTIMGISQAELADRIGVSPQQVQKYETAKNRLPAPRLWDIANVLQIDTGYFFREHRAENDRCGNHTANP